MLCALLDIGCATGCAIKQTWMKLAPPLFPSPDDKS